VSLRNVLSTSFESSAVTSAPQRVRSPPWPGTAVDPTKDAEDFLRRSEPMKLPSTNCDGVQSKRASIDALSVWRRDGILAALIGMPSWLAARTTADTESWATPSRV